MNQEQLEERRGEGERERERQRELRGGDPGWAFSPRAAGNSRSPFVECGRPQRTRHLATFWPSENEEEFDRKDGRVW